MIGSGRGGERGASNRPPTPVAGTPPPPIFGERRQPPGPGAQPPWRDVQARCAPSRGPHLAKTAPPLPSREARRHPARLPRHRYSFSYAKARCDVPPLPCPPAALLVPAGPAQAAPSSPQWPARMGAADTPLDGAVRPSARPPPLARPCGPGTARVPPARRAAPGARRLCTARPRGAAPSHLCLDDILMGCFLY